MTRLADAAYGRLSREDRILTVVCLHPGLTGPQVARILDMDVKLVSSALSNLRRDAKRPAYVRKVGATLGARWFPTDAGHARVLKTRLTFEAAVAAKEHA